VKILALETSTEYCSAALWIEGEVDAREVLAGQRHSELLLPLVHEVLQRRGLRARDLDGIAFGAGPGSFTGLRIACGIAQGLASGARLRVAGVSTLLALAAGARAARALCCLDARMGEVYHAQYAERAGRWETVCAPGLYAPERAPPLEEGDWTGCGSGFRAYPDALARRYAGRLSAIMPDVHPRAADIAQLAVLEFQEGRAVPPELAAPLYIRDKVALRSDERPAG